MSEPARDLRYPQGFVRFVEPVNAPAACQDPGAGIGGEHSHASTNIHPSAEEPTRLTLLEYVESFRRPAMMADTSYQATRLGPEVMRYLAWKRLARGSERTLDTYERDLRLICKHVNAAAKNVSHGDLMLLLEAMPEGSWGRIRSAWNDFFRWAVREGIRPDNPVDRLPKMRAQSTPVYDLWRQDELDLIVAAARQMEVPLREKLRVLTMIESGGRAAEMRGIRLGDFDLYRKTITLLGKGNKRRLVPVSPELVNTVDEYMLTEYPKLERTPVTSDFLWYPVNKRGEQLLSVRPHQGPLSYKAFWNWWKRVTDIAGVRYRKPHMTRHTYATDVLDATDGNLYAVKELLGHANVRVTETYLHSSRRHTETAVAQLAEYRRSQR